VVTVVDDGNFTAGRDHVGQSRFSKKVQMQRGGEGMVCVMLGKSGDFSTISPKI
jgi:hypothetical protein